LRGEGFLNGVPVKFRIEEIMSGPEQEASHDHDRNQNPQPEFSLMTHSLANVTV